ncbi:ATP-binding cassette domain-containing protein [uncultured Sphaerochaeta sp.]|uniref:iron ABC transporter ATP-binding protein n=1 Tax=uncultured Sphaerochaeta sp. TaxID=886478 RepID=UPI0029CA0D98|nr:ATP-binding cassette domain-containing protein [uncultured Sphaerochaeta sp.]
MIDISNARKQYGNHEVVKSVSVKIEPNTLTTLIGSNGAGKSTLLSMVGRLLDGQGEFYLEGTAIASYMGAELAKRLSILRQTNHFSVRLRVRELVAFGRYPYSKTRLTEEDQRKVDQALAYMDMTALQNNYIDEISGGERQRAYIAMVIAQDTKYILLDEPLNNLDMVHSIHIMKLLRRLVDDYQRTVVLVLHDINFAACYSDAIIAMRDGSLYKHGKTKEIITSEHLYKIYGIHIPVVSQNGRPYCLYHL